jgi:hypothetical protein
MFGIKKSVRHATSPENRVEPCRDQVFAGTGRTEEVEEGRKEQEFWITGLPLSWDVLLHYYYYYYYYYYYHHQSLYLLP